MKLLFSLMFVVALYGLISCRPQDAKDDSCDPGWYECSNDPGHCCPDGYSCGPPSDPHCYGAPQIKKVAAKNGTL
jgi:hypothetical protein